MTYALRKSKLREAFILSELKKRKTGEESTQETKKTPFLEKLFKLR